MFNSLWRRFKRNYRYNDKQNWNINPDGVLQQANIHQTIQTETNIAKTKKP